MTPPELRAHGLSTRHLNYLFGTLFGFPALMGLVLAWQVYQPVHIFSKDETPVALSAAAEEPPLVFEQMLNPPWMAPNDIEDFARDDLFKARFADLEQKRFVALLDLPQESSEILTASLPEIPSPAVSYAYGDFSPQMQLSAPAPESEEAWSQPASPGQTISGRADIVDPLTLIVGSRKLRLAGLALPEDGRTCTLLSGEKGDCRKAAADQLDFYLRWRAVSCDVSSENTIGAPLASCRVGNSDVGEWLIRRGWAVPEAATQNYRAALLFAQSYKLGQWRP